MHIIGDFALRLKPVTVLFNLSANPVPFKGYMTLSSIIVGKNAFYAFII